MLRGFNREGRECLGFGLIRILIVPDDVGFGACVVDAVPTDRVELVAAIVSFLVAHRLLVDRIWGEFC